MILASVVKFGNRIFVKIVKKMRKTPSFLRVQV